MRPSSPRPQKGPLPTPGLVPRTRDSVLALAVAEREDEPQECEEEGEKARHDNCCGQVEDESGDHEDHPDYRRQEEDQDGDGEPVSQPQALLPDTPAPQDAVVRGGRYEERRRDGGAQ